MSIVELLTNNTHDYINSGHIFAVRVWACKSISKSGQMCMRKWSYTWAGMSVCGWCSAEKPYHMYINQLHASDVSIIAARLHPVAVMQSVYSIKSHPQPSLQDIHPLTLLHTHRDTLTMNLSSLTHSISFSVVFHFGIHIKWRDLPKIKWEKCTTVSSTPISLLSNHVLLIVRLGNVNLFGGKKNNALT